MRFTHYIQMFIVVLCDLQNCEKLNIYFPIRYSKFDNQGRSVLACAFRYIREVSCAHYYYFKLH
jgi:hypothetical protein